MSDRNHYEIGQNSPRPLRGPGSGPPHMRGAGEKPKDFRKSISKLLKHARRYAPAIIVAVICASIGTATTLAGPSQLTKITDIIINSIEERVSIYFEAIEEKTGIDLKAMTEGTDNERKAIAERLGITPEAMTEGAGIDIEAFAGKIGVDVEEVQERTSIDLDKIVRICTILVIIYVVGALLTYAQGVIMTVATQKFSKSLRTDISQKINRLPLKYFDTTTFGDILSRVTNDVDTISMTMNQSIGMLVTSVTLLIGSLILMIVTNITMAATAVVSSAIGFVFMRVIMKRSHKFFSRNQKNLGAMNGHIEEIYAGHNVVRAYNGEHEAMKEFDRINDALYESNWKSQFLSGLMMPVMHFIGNIGYVAVCVVGAVLTMNDKVSF